MVERENKSAVKANKNLVWHDELLRLANSPEHKGTVREEALLAGAALLKGRYDEEKKQEEAAKNG